MAESTSTSSDAAAQRAAEQARLRKERREAKLKAGGSARLDRITGLGGRPKEDAAPTTTPPAASPPATAAPGAGPAKPTSNDGDPDEVDISEHFFAPKTTQRPTVLPNEGSNSALSDAALRNMMLGFDPASTPQGQNPLGPGLGPGGEDDAMMKMLSKMMGGGGGPPQFPGMPQPPQQQSQPIDPYTALWRLLHSIVAIGLGLYIAFLTPFTGTKIERERHALSEEENQHRKDMFFWVFATAEACLLTTRLYLDKRRPPPTGFLNTVLNYVPEPFKGYIMVFLRYGQIFSTVRADILACMFVLGMSAWWRGLVVV